MSTKRIKFLKRKKILQKDIQLSVEANGPAKRFTLRLRSEDYGFPSDSRIIVAAKTLLETLRFDLGTTGLPAPVVPIDISRLKGDRVTFNLWVVDPENARKLGSAEAIRRDATPAPSENSIPLLPVDASLALEGLLWRVDYADTDQEGHTDAPVLMIDRDAAEGSASTFVQDPAARAMILPSAMREVLTKILLVDQSHDYDETSRSWRDSWLRFASKMAGDEPPEKPDNASLSYVQDATEWITRATSRVAQTGKLLESYLTLRRI